MIPKSLFSIGLAITSLGAAIGFSDPSANYATPEQDQQAGATKVEAGIGAVTTAGVLAGTFWASEKLKNPYLSAIGMALSAGGAYASTSLLKKSTTEQNQLTGNQNPSVVNRLLSFASDFGSLYYGSKAVAPYLVRSLAGIANQAEPLMRAAGSTIDEANFSNVESWSDMFHANLEKSKVGMAKYNNNFPVQQSLNSLNQLNQISNLQLRRTATRSLTAKIAKQYGLQSNVAINGIRHATLEDAVRSGTATGARILTQAGSKLNEVGLGPGIFFDENTSKIINLNRFTPTNAISAAVQSFAKNVTIPVLGFNPVSVLRPNEIIAGIKNQHSVHIFPEGTPLGPTLKAGAKGAVSVAGDLYDIETGNFLTKGAVFRTGSYHNEVINGQTKRIFRETATGEILRKRYGAGMGESVPGKINLGNKTIKAPTSAFQKFMTNILEYNSGFNEYPSAFEKIAGSFNKKSSVRSIPNTIKAAFQGAFDREGLVGSTSVKSAFPTTVTKFGEHGYAFVPHHDIPGAASFWMFNRPTRALEELGLGNFNPATTRSASDVLWKMVFKRALPLYLSYKLVQGVQDLAHGMFGYGPLDLGADALAGFNVGSSYLRQALGINQLAQYLENLMPGSVSSPLTSLIRGFAPGMLGGAAFGTKGAIAGGLISTFLGGSSGLLLQTPQDVQAEYYGNKNVPIRHGRWYMMGSTSFWGDKPTFVPNWYRRFKSRYQYTDVEYGSAGERWANTFNPYHYAIKHYNDRPYPMATSGLEEFPLIGPALAGIYAPTMMMHTDYLYNLRNGNAQGTTGSAGIGTGSGMGQGGGVGFAETYNDRYITGTPQQGSPYAVVPNLGGLPPGQVTGATSLTARTGQEIYEQEEYLGMYGFVGKAIKQKLTGNEDFFIQQQMASSEEISSTKRAWWEQQLGDPFYTLGFFRRSFPHDRGDVQKYNPIPNTQPDFMPGSDYFKNYQIGDPYTTAGSYGEIRAPGAGYRQFYKPGAGIQQTAYAIGQSNLGMAQGYSPLDQYRILTDVAPYSKQAAYAKQYIMALDKAGGLTTQGTLMRKGIAKDATAAKKYYQFQDRIFTEGKLQQNSVIVGHYLGKGKFTVKGKKNTVYQLAGVKDITPEGEEYLSSIIKPKTELTVQSLDDKRYNEKTTTTIPTVPVLVGPINRNLITKGYAQYHKTGPSNIYSPLNTRVQYNPVERAIGSVWESVSHSNLPWMGKFMHERTAYEEYADSRVYGRDTADWNHPIRDFIMPYIYKARANSAIKDMLAGSLLAIFGANKKARVVLGATGALIGGLLSFTGSKNYIPPYRKKENDINQYYDILKYLKNRRLYSYARARAIETEHIDPQKILESVQASKEARHAVAKAIKEKYGEASLKKLYDKDNDKKDLARKANLRKALQFLQDQKYTEDEVMRESQGGFTGAALNFYKQYKSTMYGADPHGDFADIMRALPSKDREFFNSMVLAPASERNKIKRIAPLGMRRFLEAKWGQPVEDNPNLDEYFKTHHLPDDNSLAWNPAVNLNDVKLKTVEHTALDMHDFNYWPQNVEQLAREPYVPLIDPFSSNGNQQNRKRELQDIMTAQGYDNYDIYMSDYAGSPDDQIGINVKFATQPQAQEYIKSHIRKMVSPAYVN